MLLRRPLHGMVMEHLHGDWTSGELNAITCAFKSELLKVYTEECRLRGRYRPTGPIAAIPEKKCRSGSKESMSNFEFATLRTNLPEGALNGKSFLCSNFNWSMHSHVVL